MKSYSILLISVIFLYTIIGCSPATISINENNHKEKYSIKKNDNLEVVLSANPSTGYTWQIVKNDKSKLEMVDENYTAKIVKEGIVGSGGDKTFVFKAIGKGNVILEFNYSRPFEKDLAPSKRFQIIINIR